MDNMYDIFPELATTESNFGPDGFSINNFFNMGNAFNLIYGIMLVTIITMFVIMIIATIKRNKTRQNNVKHPELTVQAKVIAKRANVSSYSNPDNYDELRGNSHSHYYVTFEVESGDRMELYTPGKEYGLLIEGDEGSLTFKGTDFINFKRM